MVKTERAVRSFVVIKVPDVVELCVNRDQKPIVDKLLHISLTVKIKGISVEIVKRCALAHKIVGAYADLLYRVASDIVVILKVFGSKVDIEHKADVEHVSLSVGRG